MKREEVEKICKEFNIKNWTLNSDGTVDVDGSVNLSFKKLDKIPLKLRRVSGDFHCCNNKLTSLEGCPSHVEGNFYCHDNKITSLLGSPIEINGNFICSYNNLSNLKGCPKSISRSFICNNNKITDFEWFPRHFTGVNLTENPIYEIWKLFYNVYDVEFFNDCDPIRGDSIVLDRLNFFLEETGRPTVNGVRGYKMI